MQNRIDTPMNQELLREALRLANDIFRPQAQITDQGDIHGQLETNVRALGGAGYFGLGISREYGGMGADDSTKSEYAELIASACGVTAFTQQQLHAGGRYLGESPSAALKLEHLPKFASGDELCGVAFSHLRRPGPPMVRAERVSGGYHLSGKAPWVTGWGLLDSFILAAVLLPEGNHLYFYVPKAGNEKTLLPGPRIPLAVMNASDTVEVSFENLFLPSEYLLSERPSDDLSRADFFTISRNVYLPLGCARGSLHLLQTLAAQRRNTTFAQVAAEFSCQIDSCRREALTWAGTGVDHPDYKENALRVRAEAIVLAVRAAHAAITATGGGAHLLSNPAQRLLREAVFYTTTGQTPDVQNETLALLLSPHC